MKRVLTWLIALPLSAVLGLFSYGWWRERGFKGDHPPPGKFQVTEGGARVHYVEQLGGDPPIVFIHGNPGTCLDFSPVMNKLSATHRTVAFDRPGYGWSDRPAAELTPTEQARLIHEAVRKLGLYHPVLVGFSFGGPVSVAYSLEFPTEVSALALIAAVGSPDEKHVMPEAQANLVKPFGPLIAWSVGSLLAPDAIERGFVEVFSPKPVDPEVLERGRYQYARPVTLLSAARDWHVLETELPKLAARYGELKLPVEVLSANQDLIVNRRHADYLAAHIGSAHRVDVDQAGHHMMSTHTDAVIEAVQRAVLRVPPP